jgi:hypothetical protein
MNQNHAAALAEWLIKMKVSDPSKRLLSLLQWNIAVRAPLDVFFPGGGFSSLGLRMSSR